MLPESEEGQICWECALRMVQKLNMELYDIEPVRVEYGIERRMHDSGFLDTMCLPFGFYNVQPAALSGLTVSQRKQWQKTHWQSSEWKQSKWY